MITTNRERIRGGRLQQGMLEMMVRPNPGTWAALTALGIRNRSKPGNGYPILQSTATEAALTVTWTKTSLTKNQVVTSPLGFLHTCSSRATFAVDWNRVGVGDDFFLAEKKCRDFSRNQFGKNRQIKQKHAAVYKPKCKGSILYAWRIPLVIAVMCFKEGLFHKHLKHRMA